MYRLTPSGPSLRSIWYDPPYVFSLNRPRANAIGPRCRTHSGFSSSFLWMVDSAGNQQLQSLRYLPIDHLGAPAVVLTLCSFLKLRLDYLPSAPLHVAILCSPQSLLGGANHLSSLWVVKISGLSACLVVRICGYGRYIFLPDIPSRSLPLSDQPL